MAFIMLAWAGDPADMSTSIECRALSIVRLPAATVLALWLALGLTMGAVAARADALDGLFEVQSAFVNLTDGVYQLHARVKYPANEETAVALRDGVSLSYDLDVEIARARRFWLDAEITAVTLRRELMFHAVSERYVVRDPRSGAQSSYATLAEALESLGTVDGWPILVASQVPREADYRVSVRASVRRGKLTDALRVILFWNDGWQRESEWYSWSLPR
jgi:Domain of unknown function (DUF4390)